MNITTKVLPVEFQPIEITIRLDTPDELLSLFDVANHSSKVTNILKDHVLCYGNCHNQVLLEIFNNLKPHKDKIA